MKNNSKDLYIMLIIKKEDIANYRYAIGKITFLDIYYKEFELKENFHDSNLMLVKSKLDGTESYISLFRKAESTSKLQESIKIITYYEKRPSGYEKETSNEMQIFSEKFITLYQENLENAFKKPSVIVSKLSEVQKDIIAPFYKHSINFDMKLYKYRSQDSVEENRYKVLDGYISFCPPSSFNDPFDCNIMFEKNQDMSHLFRVLCLTESYENILMWSYYGDSHKGYCFEYESSCISEKISENSIDGVCIIGKVDYKDKRPETKTPTNKFSYTDIKFYIDASFTKFKEWKHEKEYRYVIISDKLTDNNNEYINLKTNITQIYQGIKGENCNHGSKIKCKKLFEDPVSYGFVVNEIHF